MRWTIIIGISLITALFSGCAEKQEPLPAEATNAVEIKGFAFNPTTITIAKGTTVTWTQSDSALHTVRSVSGDELNSPELSEGQTFSHTFKESGNYYYYCSIHTSMRGIVVVN